MIFSMTNIKYIILFVMMCFSCHSQLDDVKFNQLKNNFINKYQLQNVVCYDNGVHVKCFGQTKDKVQVSFWCGEAFMVCDFNSSVP